MQRRLDQPLPSQFDQSRSKSGGWFELTFVPLTVDQTIPLAQAQDWLLKIRDRSGLPLAQARVLIRGGMPQHGHSFATEPQVSERSPGEYLVSGLEFQMPGWWAIEIEVRRGTRQGQVRFDLLLGQSEQLRSLWIGSLPPLSASRFPSNPYALDPKAAALGQELFEDTSLSKDGKMSCATCHRAERAMTDGSVREVPLQGPRKVPSVIGVAYQSWFFWDGRKDSLWSQALGPIENPNELGVNAADFVGRARAKYGAEIESVFGSAKKPVPEAFADLGRAIAAYEAALRPGPSAFDRYVEKELGLQASAPAPAVPGPFGDCEKAGLRTFLGKGRCIQCHFGPRFENGSFHNTGVESLPTETGMGRFAGVRMAKADPYRCNGSVAFAGGKAPPGACRELEAAAESTAALSLAFKTPSLRNVALTAPYMHNGSIKTLEEVVEHYRIAPTNSQGGDLLPLDLNREEAQGLVCFLKSLTSEALLK
jgi:cytochrome c peroxidase